MSQEMTATTQDTTQPGITLDEQIAFINQDDGMHVDMARAILASLIRLREIEGKLREPTEEMLDAACDWSLKKYGQGVGNDGAIGCWQAMLDAALRSGGRETSGE